MVNSEYKRYMNFPINFQTTSLIQKNIFSGTLDELLKAIDQADLHMYDNVPVLMSIAKVLTKINFDFERIEKLYHRVLEIEPNNFVAHKQLATEYLKRNRSDIAIKHLKKTRHQ